MPFFKDVVVGCFVRVGIGAHEGRMVYRVSTYSNTQYYTAWWENLMQIKFVFFLSMIYHQMYDVVIPRLPNPQIKNGIKCSYYTIYTHR